MILNNDVHVACIGEVTIGSDSLLASGVFISDHSHGLTDHSDVMTSPALRTLTSKGAVHIGPNVWIGEKVTILAGVSIGANTIVGAHSVVTKSLPANCIVVGQPARILRKI